MGLIIGLIVLWFIALLAGSPQVRPEALRREQRDRLEAEIADLDSLKTERKSSLTEPELLGIGIFTVLKDRLHHIVRVVPGGPADKQGVQSGDMIISVAQGLSGRFESVVDWSPEKLSQLIRGPKGTMVTLKVLAANASSGKPRIITVVRYNLGLNKQDLEKENILALNALEADKPSISADAIVDLPKYNFAKGSARLVVAKAIQEFVAERQIKCLTHFTRVENLGGILEHGILGRVAISNQDIVSEFNDEHRLDGYANAICLSISSPNYALFYRTRKSKYPHLDWVVIRLRPSVLWEKDCMFYPWNAAKTQMSKLPNEMKVGPAALRHMFENLEGHPPREKTRIPLNYPTHPQAEILVREEIGTEYILDICVNDPHEMFNVPRLKAISNIHSKNFQFCNEPAMFKPRLDWAHWQKDTDLHG